ncbi:MAG: hypothetical protein ABJA16_03630 [Nakamurella sp.]
MSNPTDHPPVRPENPGEKPRQPSLVAGMVLLVLAGVLIVVVLVQPEMAPWLKTTIAVVAILVVIALIAFSVVLVRSTKQAGRGR